MSLLKKIAILLSLPILAFILYFSTAKLLSYFPKEATLKAQKTESIYLLYGDIHTDIVLNLDDLNRSWFEEIEPIKGQSKGYLAIGWGDKESFLHPGTYDTLPLSVILKALFINTSSLLHVSYHREVQHYRNHKEIRLSKAQLMALKKQLFQEFQFDAKRYPGYYKHDYFYTASRDYNALTTCNTWTGDRLREVNLTMSYWTPFRQNVLDALP